MGLTATERMAPQSKHIRYTLSQDKRIEDACAYLGCTIQSFVQEATLERLAKIESEKRADKNYQERLKKPSERRREVRGLGLRTGRSEAPPAADPPPTAPAPQVIVNVPATTPSGASDVSMLAAFVAKGSVLERESRLRRARDVLAASLDGGALEDAKKALDSAITALAPKSDLSLDSPKTGGGVLDWFKR